MVFFWSKTIEEDKIIYTRSKKQTRAAYLVMFFGFLLMTGPYFLGNFKVVQQFYALIPGPGWLGTLPMITGGLIVAVDAFLVGYPSLILPFAKLRNKKWEATISSTGDVKIVIEK